MGLSAAIRRLLGGEAPVEAPVSSGGFLHERTPRPEWVAALREHSPLTDAHGALELLWEPGDVWIPGQRWMLYEMIPADPEFVDYERLLELRGPNPRATGHMCTARTVDGQFACLCKVKLEGWRNEDGEPSGVNLTQWKLYQRTGRFGRPWWVIQGSRGGHKAFLTKEERMFLAAAGKKTEMPAIGELPYAEFDQRVIEHVVRFNRLRQMGLSLRDYRVRMRKGYRLHKAEVEKELRKQLVQWLDEQMAPEHELFVDAMKKGELDGHAPKTDTDWEKVGDAAEHAYIETGQLLHPSRVK